MHALDAWEEIEDRLISVNSTSLAETGIELPNRKGTHYLVKPFMENHGYRDGHSWWIKEKQDDLGEEQEPC